MPLLLIPHCSLVSPLGDPSFWLDWIKFKNEFALGKCRLSKHNITFQHFLYICRPKKTSLMKVVKMYTIFSLFFKPGQGHRWATVGHVQNSVWMDSSCGVVLKSQSVLVCGVLFIAWNYQAKERCTFSIFSTMKSNQDHIQSWMINSNLPFHFSLRGAFITLKLCLSVKTVTVSTLCLMFFQVLCLSSCLLK